ncbi:MAG: alkaline phosphatase family protein [Chthoniobacterales bacterium]
MAADSDEKQKRNLVTDKRTFALGLVPLVLLLAAIVALGPEHQEANAGQARAFEPSHHFRTVVFILDSAGKSQMFDPELMPFLNSLRTSSVSGRSRSCAAKATFPCIKSIFEGREAAMGTTLQDFSAFASSRTTWPTSLAALGTRLVVASDHTLNRLYPHAFVDALNYEDLHAPLLERDAFVYRRARQWLADPSIDVLLLHIIGTDKVAHEYPVRGPEYRKKYREVDDFIREVAGRLEPNDYLYAISDHGHNELGGHTEEAGFLVRGPIFPEDVRENLNAEDMLFLLSVPYGLLLPPDYEGQVRMDLTRLTPDAAERWLSEQAKLWRVKIAGLPLDQAQARLNTEVAQRRTAGRRNTALQVAWTSAPFLLAAALFLIAELRPGRHERSRARLFQLALFVLSLALVLIGVNGAGWIVVVAVLLRCVESLGVKRTLWVLPGVAALGALAFWLLPAGLTWLHDEAHRPLAFTAFYLAAATCGLAFVRFAEVESRRMQILNVLWIIAVAVWLLAYFGPLGYSLTRHGSLIVLTIFPVAAVILAGGWRTLFSKPALLLPTLFPLVFYDVESFNLKYPLLDRIAELRPTGQMVVATSAVALFVVALRWTSRNRWLIALLSAVLWLVVGRFSFQFDLGKLVGTLLACCWLAGCLELFRRAAIPLRWFALIGAVFIFVLFTFLLNGFALSHVDFRFANDKIIPFAHELWRAPQLIAWAMAKYAFGLLPAIAVLRLSSVGDRLWRQILLFGWWRELTIIASALGLAIFNARGMRDLCEEEIYFWTFLNAVLFVAYLIFPRTSRSSAVPDIP